eukprot:551313-Prorocentrum_minimum.AAC.1
MYQSLNGSDCESTEYPSTLSARALHLPSCGRMDHRGLLLTALFQPPSDPLDNVGNTRALDVCAPHVLYNTPDSCGLIAGSQKR